MKIRKALILSLLLFAGCFCGNAQKIIQFTGLVVTGDSLRAVPFATVAVMNRGLGTTTDMYGYFSFAAHESDSIVFSAVGYKSSSFIIPSGLEEDKYSMVHMLSSDTIFLQETIVYPWPSKEQFKEAFLYMDIPDDDIERAKKNLDPDELAARMEAMPATGSLTFKYQMQERMEKMYYTGQAPPIQLFNPFAWAQFVKAWKNGDFKRKDKND